MARLIGRFLAGAGLLFIAATTLVPIPQQTLLSRLTPWWCLVCGDRGGVDVIDNVLLFIPFALGLRLAGLPARAVVVTGGLMSLGIELLQWGVIQGRDASLSDLLTNTLGSWIGAGLGTRYRQVLRPQRTSALWLAAVSGALWLLVQLLTGALLQPWSPAQDLQGAWSREVYGHPVFDGQILSARLGGRRLPRNGPLSPEIADYIGRDDVEIRVQLISGHRAPIWSPIIEVLGPVGAVLSLEGVRKDLAFQAPMRSSRLRLGRPALRFPGALPVTGSMVDVRAGERNGTIWGQWTVGGITHSRALGLSPSFGWSLLTPFRIAYGPEVHTVTVLWIAGWLLPTAYWTARARGRCFPRGIALLLLVISGLGVVPALLGLRPVHWSEWLGAVLGLAAGAAGHYSAAYFEKRCDSPSIKEFC